MMYQQDTWCLIDPSGTAEHHGAGRCVAFITLEPHRYRHFLKGCFGSLATTLIMSPWSYQEVLQLHSEMYQHLDKQLVTELYAKWGGNVRYVLQHADIISQQNLLNTAVNQCSRQTLDTLRGISVYYPPVSMPNSDYVELALHITSDDYIYGQSVWASSYVLNKYIDQRAAVISDKAEVFLKCFDSTPELQYLQRNFF
jgi:hypothetical protein